MPIFKPLLIRDGFLYFLPEFKLLDQLEGTARYAGLLLAPTEGFGLWLVMQFLLSLGHFWCSVVTSVTFLN